MVLVKEYHPTVEKMLASKRGYASRQDLAMKIVIATELFVPIDTGLLREDIDFTLTRKGFLVGSSLAYAVFQEFGTKAHMILPQTAKVLSWLDQFSGERLYSKGHMVKGVKATQFFYKSAIMYLGRNNVKKVKN